MEESAGFCPSVPKENFNTESGPWADKNSHGAYRARAGGLVDGLRPT